jgi:hypothetical protein
MGLELMVEGFSLRVHSVGFGVWTQRFGLWGEGGRGKGFRVGMMVSLGFSGRGLGFRIVGRRFRVQYSRLGVRV